MPAIPQYCLASFFGSPNPFLTLSLSATQTPVSTQPSEPPEHVSELNSKHL
ncbi:6053_t:CDS:1, partial [Gigaspora rosea]